jgi:hypothetical protein
MACCWIAVLTYGFQMQAESVLFQLVLVMMINVLKMIFQLGTFPFLHLLGTKEVEVCWKYPKYAVNFRKELVWPELDQLLRDEDDVAVSTPYTAAIPEYRVVFHDAADAAQDKSWANANGHALFDAQHPCRYCIVLSKQLNP